ncbi:hypothetical protein CLV98_12342 [Dyadobacter jejuensis]|uniref:Uncharacterized protein n=1 Tax=Dyadobacter jejuensis TaxID=1082580 RepID=A0A316A868_9BACT|nr:hypothetical protein [Dyadobacter jejuensis]PWJ53428.1 hypothetical protein CLV98_12342 [Dyadobacter jejuensis]
MSTYNINELKFLIAQKYKIPESEIDESVLSLYVLIDAMNDQAMKSMVEQKEMIEKALNDIKDLQSKNLQPISYDDPKTAFWGNFGSKGIISISIAIMVLFSFLALRGLYFDRQLVKNYQNLKDKVKVVENGYFISKEDYKINKDGILIYP